MDSFFLCSEALDCLTLIFCLLTISVLYKFFGIFGLYAYNVIATIASNIQVMKIAHYQYITESMAMGTVIFSTIFIVDAVIIERHGGKYAQNGLFISMTSYLAFILMMYLTILYPSTTLSSSSSLAISDLFTPSWSVFTSSLAAYFISQFCEIYIYLFLKKFTPQHTLWLRYNIANALAMLVDQIAFSILCWKVFNVNDISLSYIFKNYIAFNYLIRITISVCSTPLAYRIRRIKPMRT